MVDLQVCSKSNQFPDKNDLNSLYFVLPWFHPRELNSHKEDHKGDS